MIKTLTSKNINHLEMQQITQGSSQLLTLEESWKNPFLKMQKLQKTQRKQSSNVFLSLFHSSQARPVRNAKTRREKQ